MRNCSFVISSINFCIVFNSFQQMLLRELTGTAEHRFQT
ncbi:hypothetical protein CHCC14809_1806 [Bacillus licheniformis]|nr:hypothetical protein B4092_1898 [Bacillus licheniformis]TWM18786.1 hypothetical protein CHCC14821_2017 [Bacillus paralicheniformis]KYC75217.1 hypothetical protein B4090_1903 [Bacillus licheniformis]KYD01102.1 hypothetical protein B4164_1785 [Bacillus licheniformis]TWJ67099.1 hypothetical protein CHCC5020_2568 [Bacillus licheniformis]